tara:strand:+ start:2990 stop:4765 length:1776 start_codon:yes stop_codon:yes gene_type:complete
MSSIVERLTENIVHRDLAKEGAALLQKWERTGLLEGMDNDRDKNTMAVLLENQAKELLREASTMGAGGDVEGFASVAFPIVRRVFGGLIANELVSVQPMSLPSGLIFFMDFQVGSGPRLGSAHEDSLYGGGVVAGQITGGVNLTEAGGAVDKSFYNLNNGFSSPTASHSAFGFGVSHSGTLPGSASYGKELNRLCRHDPDLQGSVVVVCTWTGSADIAQLDAHNLVAMSITASTAINTVNPTSGTLVRRLTQVSTASANNLPSSTVYKGIAIFKANSGVSSATLAASITASNGTTANCRHVDFPIVDNFDNVGERALGGVVGANLWDLENQTQIPEIDIKVDSISVTAKTKKLKAKWSPELGQDLNAYHNMDAEVELTGILSEQIALEIDREILEDLIKGATGGTYYWSRSPALFVNRTTGAEVGASSAAPDFTGTVSEWYETLLETVNDVSAQIHRKTLRGGANFIVTSPEVASILEMTAGFRASVTVDGDRGTAGTLKAGSVNKKWDVYIDPYFPRNVVLVGRKGNSFLESGYVYAPYVPLQVTPTIFGPEDFVPRKGVMTRYAKKMVRPDMYGLVVVRGLLGESGATS